MNSFEIGDAPGVSSIKIDFLVDSVDSVGTQGIIKLERKGSETCKKKERSVIRLTYFSIYIIKTKILHKVPNLKLIHEIISIG